MTEINKDTPASKLTPGGDIYEAGNAREFKLVTGAVFLLSF